MSESGRGPVLRHARAAGRHPLALAAKIVASVVSVAVVSSLGIAAIAVADISHNVQTNAQVHLVQQKDVGQTAPPVTKTIEPEATALAGEFNVLLVGTDTRTGQGGQFDSKAELRASSGAGNNDVTMLLHVNAAHTAATVVSFPRDLVIPIPSCPSPKGGWYSAMSAQMLNTSLTYGGLTCPVLTIEKLIGIDDINYAAEISFDGVAAMSDAVGGVPVCLATPINDPYVGLNLPAGTSTIQGQQALQFLRSRHGVEDGSDLARISNQQNFLSSLLRTITSAGTLGNPIKLYQLAAAATQNMTLSDTMGDAKTMVGMAVALKSIPLSQITFVQYPVLTDPTNPNRVVPDTYGAPILAKAIQNDQPVVLSATTGRGTELAPSSTPSAPAGAATAPPATGTATAPPGDVTLSKNATGQTADQQTCTKGVTGHPGE
ncbi:LCP family protein [Gryllotalpicola protaetiae]|nr:LCP family protein [Gryllotalpicola protaetiae]